MPSIQSNLRIVVISLAACWSVTPSAAIAAEGDLATKWPVNDADPMSSIPSEEARTKEPLEFGYWLQDMVYRAEGAYRKSDWQNAVKYYRVLAKAVPGTARSYSRMCDAYGKLGELQLAIENCRTAIGLKGAKVIDHAHYADLLLRKPSFGPADIEDIEASLVHLREFAKKHPQVLPGEKLPSEEPPKEWVPPSKQPPKAEEPAAELNDPKAALKEKIRAVLEDTTGDAEPLGPVGGFHIPTQIEFLSCRLAVRTRDVPRLDQCMAMLRGYNAPEKLLMPFSWASALHQKDEARALALLNEAAQLGVAQPVLTAMRAEHDKVFAANVGDVLRERWVIPAGVALLAGLGFVVWRLLAQRARLATTSTHA